MPEVTAWVDQLREACGRDLVDGAIRAGVQAQRRYEALKAQDGPRAADAWLAAQKWPRGVFWASEGGRTLGVKTGGARCCE